MIRFMVILVALVLVITAAAGPVAASHTGLLYGASSRVVITLSEWKFSPSTITIAAGESVDFVLENKGTQSHVFMVYPAPKTPYKGTGDWWEWARSSSTARGSSPSPGRGSPRCPWRPGRR